MNSEDLVGQQIDQYKILRHIDRGGMADVYLAQDVNLQRQVAFKLLLGALVHDEQFVLRFQREAQAVAQLNHPNIVQVYSIGNTASGQPYIAMQYIEGGSLRQKLRELADRGKLLTTEQALNITRQLAQALLIAHQAGIVHRDLKPSNVLIRDSGTPVIVDLGIAARDDGAKLTQTGHLIGTPHYMSPEQGLGQQVDGRADIYSLGIILYEMLGGQTPFNADSAFAVIHQHLYEPVPPLAQFRAGLQPLSIQLVDRCLQKKPLQRWQTATELVAAIDLALQAEGNSGPNPQATNVLTHLSDSLLLSRQKYVRKMPTAQLRTPITPPPTPYQPPLAPQPSFPTPSAQQNPSNSWAKFFIGFFGVLFSVALLLGGWFFLLQPWLAEREAGSQTTESASLDENVVVEDDPISDTATLMPPTAESPKVDVTAVTVEIIVATTTPPPETTTIAGSVPPTPTLSSPTATPPPVASHLVFQSNRDGDYEIFIMDLIGNDQRQLTNNTLPDNYPVVSPSGEKVLFQSERNGNVDLYVFDIDGRNETRLTTHIAEDRLPTWSSDGERIAFISNRDGDYELFIINANGSGLTQITFNDLREGHVSWSVNDKLAYNSGTTNGLTWEIYTIDPDGQNRQQLTNNSISDWAPEWSPDGRHILYLSTVSGDPAIFVMNADGSNPRMIYNSPGYEWGADWSPAGDQIAFTTEESGPVDSIFIANRDGSAVRLVTSRGSYPAWVLRRP